MCTYVNTEYVLSHRVSINYKLAIFKNKYF